MIRLPLTVTAPTFLDGPDGKPIAVREGRITWQRSLHPVRLGAETYDVKPQVEVERKPLLRELALLRFAEQEGWQGAWMDTYHWGIWRAMPLVNERWVLPERYATRLSRIVEPQESKKGLRWRGCWDIFVWRSNAIAFIESKGGEGLADTQRAFFAKAIAVGIPASAFTVVEWDLWTVPAQSELATPQATSRGAPRGKRKGTTTSGQRSYNPTVPGNKTPGNKTLPAVPDPVVALVGSLSRAQVFTIMNPKLVSAQRPSRVRNGLSVRGAQVMTPGGGTPGASKRTKHGDVIAAKISPILPVAYRVEPYPPAGDSDQRPHSPHRTPPSGPTPKS